MLRSVRAHLRANVVAYLALFVALGGTGAYAANEWTGENIVDESLTAADIKNGEVKNAELKNNAVNGGKVADDSISGSDVNEATLAKVPSADTLDNVDSADLKLNCPAGTVRVEAACLETASRSAVVFATAHNTCRDLGRRMPTIAELMTGRLHPAITFGTEMTDAFQQDKNGASTSFIVTSITAGGSRVSQSATVAQNYRCVAAPIP